MKISEIEGFELGVATSPGAASWASTMILVKVTTTDGYVGYGEAVPTLRALPVLESIKEVARVYKGKEVENREENRKEWRKNDFYLSMSFETTTALSAIDIACWDIVGKMHGAPIYELLGGASRERVLVYANGWYDNCVTPEHFALKAKKIKDMGYKAIKFDPFGHYFDYIDQKGIEMAVNRVKAIRDTVGDNMDILIEHHGRFNANSAIMVAKALEPYNPLFVEEPVHPKQLYGLRKYRENTDLKVALGERILTKEEADLFMSEDLVDFLQPDICNIGGFTEMKKVVAIAEMHGIEMALHNAFGPIQNAASLQVDAWIPNFLIQESFYDFFPQWKRDLIYDSTKVENGYCKIPDKPGLGIEVNEGLIEKYHIKGMEMFDVNEPVWVVKGTWR
jgi:galactonate dehydratase